MLGSSQPPVRQKHNANAGNRGLLAGKPLAIVAALTFGALLLGLTGTAQAQDVESTGAGAAGCVQTLSLVKPLTLDKTTVAWGETIHGSVTYKNTHICNVFVIDLAIGTRPAGHTHNCPQDNCPSFVPDKTNFTLQPGESVTLDASFTPDSSNTTPGFWSAYPSYQSHDVHDGNGGWHDGPSVEYMITSSSGGGGGTPTCASLGGTCTFECRYPPNHFVGTLDCQGNNIECCAPASVSPPAPTPAPSGSCAALGGSCQGFCNPGGIGNAGKQDCTGSLTCCVACPEPTISCNSNHGNADCPQGLVCATSCPGCGDWYCRPQYCESHL